MTKKAIINYTSRDFVSIKQELIDHAKRYYPDRYNDFNESSFGSMMFDAVAYVGDVLSFYLDFQVNESYIETALEYDTIKKIATQMGYKFYGSPCSYGKVSLFCVVPAANSGLGPNPQYIPILKKGTKFNSSSGNVFTLLENVDFNKSNVEYVVARYNDITKKPSSYALKSYGRIRSGDEFTTEVEIGSATKFLRINIGPSTISEIISVIDSDGNIYHQVDYLSQDTVYKETTNLNYISDGVPSIIKPFVAARRFVMEQDDEGTFLRFGYGSDDNTNTVVDVSDPKSVVLKFSGKNYFTDSAFDPNKFLNTDKFGIAPANTTLRITFVANTTSDTNESVGSIDSIASPSISFVSDEAVSLPLRSTIASTFEVSNEEAIVVSSAIESSEELRYRALANYATQNRAVTKNDYEAYCYQMPPKFGSIKRASIVNDPGYTNRRLTLYVISQDSSGNLAPTNATAKQNLKVWLEKNKMISDAIDVLDAKIINIGFDYQIVSDSSYDKVKVLSDVQTKLQTFFGEKLYIGEPIYITQIYNLINKVDGVIDTVKVTPKVNFGGNYSSVVVDIMDLKSKDGSYLKAPKNVIFEIKDPSTDFTGVVV